MPPHELNGPRGQPGPDHSSLREVIVAASVARVTELSVQSDISFEDAVQQGIERASSTLRGITSAWVKDQSVDVTDGKISGYRVNLLITFVLD